LSDHGAFLPEHFLESVGEFVAQAFAGHGKNIPVGLARGRFQVFARPAAHVKDVALVVDEHGRRGVMLQDQLIREGLETERRFRFRAGRGPGGQIRGKGRGKIDWLRPRGGLGSPIEPRLAVEGGKQVGEVADRLRAAEKQDAAGIQAVVKQRKEFLLQLRGEVDQQVAAAQNIQLGKGRVHDEALRGKDHHFPDLRAHPVAAFHRGKEPFQPLRRYVGGNIRGINALAGLVNRVLVQVGGKDGQRKFLWGLDLLHRLLEHHGQGIGLLPGGAAGHPRPQGLAGRPAGEERREDAVAQLLPGGAIAKETCHPDQQLLEKQIQFLRVFLQVANIDGNLVNLVDAHAAFDPAVEGVSFVERKVMAGVGAQQDDRLFQRTLRLVFQRLSGAVNQRSALQIGEDPPGQIVHGGHNIRQPRVNHAARHAVEFGCRGILHQHHARILFDGPQPQRAVGAHARENNANAVFLLVLRQGAEEEINRQAQSARRCRFEQVQDSVQDGHVFVRRDHIDPVRLDQGAILDLDHSHAGGALEQFGHDAFAGRVQMLDDDKSHAAVLRHARQEMFQSLQSSGRGADADDGESRSRGTRRRDGDFRGSNLGRPSPAYQ
jgi:hypothetical protein